MGLTYSKILPGTSSVQLVRTNPKLTGNVKITVDSNQDVWLNSIDANEELSKDLYKRFPVDTNRGHDSNLFSFFNNGKTTTKIVFDLQEKVNIHSTSLKFEDQYDFSNYFSGVRYSTDRRYTERFSMFAPLYLKSDIPNYYVVFKIPGAMEGDITKSKNSYPINKNDYIKELLSKAQIVSTFDLSNTSKIGKYLRGIIHNPLFPQRPLTINFENNRGSSYNGISYQHGVFTEAHENLYPFLQSGNPIRSFEEYITLGFERNGVIFPNIVNLEFMFDDQSASNYEFNRYIGFYCNAIELDSAVFDSIVHFNLKLNTPRFRSRYFPSEDVVAKQTNPNGLDLYFQFASKGPNSITNAFATDFDIFFNYVQDKQGKLHLIKPGSLSYSTPTSGKMKLSSTSADLGKLFGPDISFIEDQASISYGKNQSHIDGKVLAEFKTGDSIKFYHPTGTRLDSDGKYDEFQAVEYHPSVPNSGDYYTYHVQANTGDVYYFNCTGNVNNICKAIVGCINATRYRPFKALRHDDRFWIILSSAGDHDKQYKLLYHSLAGNTWDSIQISKKQGQTELSGNIINFVGGDNFKYHLNIESEHKDKIDALFKTVDGEPVYDLLLETDKNWVGIVKTSYDIQYINEDVFSDPKLTKIAIDKYDANMSLYLEEEAVPLIPHNLTQIRKQFYFRLGVLSFLDLADFDFDLYSSNYARFQEMDLYKEFYVPAGIKALDLNNNSYIIYGSGVIDIEGTSYTEGQVIYGTGIKSYTVLGGDPIVLKYNVEQNGDLRLDIPIWDEDSELQRFSGFSTIHEQQASKVDQSIEYLYRDKFITQANSEYDVLNETLTKDFASKSLILPYICKWGYVNGTDVRDNPYRLNAEFIFGQDNFSPNQSEPTANPSRFTHEWFYIESKFDYVNDPTLSKKNFYYFDTKLDLTALLNDPEEFLRYFAYVPEYNGTEISRAQHRYTLTEFEPSMQLYETLFKGFRLAFKEISDTPGNGIDGKPNYVRNSKRFADYKFTTLLRVIPEDICSDSTQPIRFRFIEHTDYKFVVLLIEVVLNIKNEIAPNFLSLTPTSPAEVSSSVVTLDNFYQQNPWDSFLPYFHGIFGEYKLKLDSNNMSDLSYAFLYYAKDKKYNTLASSYSNTKVIRKLDFSSSGIYQNAANSIFVKSLDNERVPNWISQLEEEILSTNIESFLLIRIPAYVYGDPCAFTEYVIGARDGLTSFADSMIGSVTKNELKIKDSFYDYVTLSDQPTTVSNLVIALPQAAISYPYVGPNWLTTNYYLPALTTTTWKGSKLFQIMGGKNYYSRLLGKLAFSKFKEYVDTLSTMVEYESWSLNSSGVAVKSAVQEYYAEVESPVTLAKSSFPSSIPELIQTVTSKPKIVNKKQKKSLDINPRIAGYQFMRNEISSYSSIFRYNGGYEPILKPVISYVKNFDVTYEAPGLTTDVLSLANVKFNVYDDNLFDLANFNHIKVAETRILSLEDNPKYQTVYPLIGESPIGREKMFLLNSSWDWGYHWKYVDKFFKNPVSGTLRVDEDQNYIGKVMTLPEIIELEIFTDHKVPHDIKSYDITPYDMIWNETDTEVHGRINVARILTTYLSNNGVSTEFAKSFIDELGAPITISNDFLGKSNLSAYTNAYIQSNFLKLFYIDDVQFFTKENRKLVSISEKLGANKNTIHFTYMLLDNLRKQQGFSLSNSIKINKSDRLELEFRIPKHLGFSLNISPKIKIKLL